MTNDNRPPGGWGTGTKQTIPGYPDPTTEQTPGGYAKLRTDADEIRRHHRFGRFDADQWTTTEKPLPNCLVHEPPGESEWGHVGGTNFFATGAKGSGKSTFGLYWAERLMEVNDEAVVWRGSSSRSEWLPLKPWTTLCLPANADIEASWKPRDIRERNAGETAAPEEIVRDVIYYDDPIDLNDQLDPGKFHVVYPDPSFTRCEQIMRDSDFCPQPVEYTPQWEVDAGEEATPIVHWWFAWAVARLEYGPWDWTSLIFDEAADLAPQSAKAGKNQTYEKVQALRRVMADSRKFNLSVFMFGHHEPNVHSMIRRTFEWRVDLADETANPCQENNDSPPVGFNGIPMKRDQLSRQDVGRGLLWTETRFSRFKWSDISVFDEDRNRWLKVAVGEPDTHARSSGPEAAPRGAADD